MCYIDNLVMKNCTLINTTLAFEYSNVDVQVNGKIDSVMNPSRGIIRADEIGELIMEKIRFILRIQILNARLFQKEHKDDYL